MRGIRISLIMVMAGVFLSGWGAVASGPIQQIHGGTCWVSATDTAIKAVSFNDRAVGYWNGLSLKEDVAKALSSVGLTPAGEVEVALACSDLGHQVVLRGKSLQGHAYCMSTNMSFTSFELSGDSSRGGSLCHPYMLQELLIYEPDAEVRGRVLTVLTSRKYVGDIESVSASGAVVEVKLRSSLRFHEKMFLEVLSRDADFPEGVAMGLNDVMGFPAEQVGLAKVSTDR